MAVTRKILIPQELLLTHEDLGGSTIPLLILLYYYILHTDLVLYLCNQIIT